MSRTEYERYLMSDAWRQRRHDALILWRWSCALNANHKGRLEVHHRTYVRIGHEDLDDLIVLCVRCHKRFHGLLLPTEPWEWRHRQSQAWLPFEPVIPIGADFN